MPLHLGAPKLPKTDNKSECYNTSFTHGSTPVFMSPGMPNSVASSTVIALYRKRREGMIARGEDPDAAAKAREAKHEARKDKVKGLFGMKSESSKEQEAQYSGKREVLREKKSSAKGPSPEETSQQEGLQDEVEVTTGKHLHSGEILGAAVTALGSLGGAL